MTTVLQKKREGGNFVCIRTALSYNESIEYWCAFKPSDSLVLNMLHLLANKCIGTSRLFILKYQ